MASQIGVEPTTFRLGVRVRTGNLYNFELIQIKESLDFTNYSVISCQNKKN